MTPDSEPPEGHSPYPARGRISTLAVEPSTAAGTALGRIYQSLADFTVLTRLLRDAVDARLAAHLTVTGWQNGVLRVLLDQPALATRWRFQEPGVRRSLARHAALRSLRECRLVMTDLRPRHPSAAPASASASDPASLRSVPVDVLRELAATEEHVALRDALLRLSAAAEGARQRKPAARK